MNASMALEGVVNNQAAGALNNVFASIANGPAPPNVISFAQDKAENSLAAVKEEKASRVDVDAGTVNGFGHSNAAQGPPEA